MTEANLDERERKLNERERRLNEEKAKLNILNGKFSIKAIELKDRMESVRQRESEYERKHAELEEQTDLLNQKKAELENSFLAREISVKEREEALLKKEREQELELKQKGLELKTAQEAELAQERMQAIESVQEQLEKQRVEFEASIIRYEQERKEAAEQRAAKIRVEAEADALKIRTSAESDAAAKMRAADEGIAEENRRREEAAAAYEKRKAALEVQIAELEQREAQLESSLSEREISMKESEEEYIRREREQKLELKQKSLEQKAVQEAELAQERIQAMQSLEEHLAQQRAEFEAVITRYEKERKKDAEAAAEKIRSEAKAEAEKVRYEAEVKAEKIWNDAQEDSGKLRSRAAELEEGNAEKKKELDAREEELSRREAELAEEFRKNDREKRRLELKEEDLESRENDLESIVSKAMTEKAANFHVQLEAKEQALRELREKVRSLMEGQDAVEKFKASIGKDPAAIENEMMNLQKIIEELKEQLSRRAPAEIQEERDDLRKECEDYKAYIAELKKENRNFAKKNRELALLETVNIGLESKNEELESLVGELKSQNDTYKQRIERLCSPEERLADREQRLAEINKGILLPLTGAGLPMKLSEAAWLENIYQQCDRFGIHFPQRILYAFHTALKIADWSSITVLSGVSGTGKSELPRLYAAFGGLNFISVPVQPDWDSQESMLGFFNSIDNRFEPEALLRFMVQCTENEDYSKYMSIVLLDEMNLAHVEYYFSDFLSKLETRRGMSESAVPSVEVKLGAGVEPYQLRLERSILWTGTMNQDETTKSLSDKVLDRGLVIHFPRPKELRSRKTMGSLDKAVKETNRPMLSRSQWESWIVKEAALQGEQEKELLRYRSVVEGINSEMEHVGRALGHRVWQSIEYYMLNYPSVTEELKRLAPGQMSGALRESMKTAFEDQIVQKIMPKLRGVETRGRSRENLDKIEAMLEDHGFERLKDDFEIACEQGYGQFIWSSAKYIETDAKIM